MSSLFRIARRRRGANSNARVNAARYAVEQLETRLLLSGTPPTYSLSQPITAVPGETFDAYATIGNSSLTNPVILPPLYYPPLTGTVVADMHLSPDATPYNGYADIGQASQNVNLTLGSSTVWTVACTMPKSVAPGKYSLVELIDLSGTNANTNYYWQVTNVVTITPPPALSGSFTGKIPQAAKAGAVIFPDLRITDAAGTANVVAGAETTNYYLSSTADLSKVISPALATENYTLNLNEGGAGYYEPALIEIPEGVAPGEYYLVAQIDATRAINPADTNNYVASSDPITIGLPSLSGSFTETAPPTAKPGDTIKLPLQITDAADAADVDNKIETTAYFLATSASLSTLTAFLVDNSYEMTLAAGASTPESQAVTIPSNTTPGTYYLVAQIDTDRTINPNDTDNFAASGPIKIEPPSLSGTFVSPIPMTANPGGAIALQLQITDAAGSGDVVDGDETTAYFLATAPNLAAQTALLGANTYIMNLSAGDSKTESKTVTIPGNTVSGTYYLVAQIDSDQQINANDTNNFAASGPIAIGMPADTTTTVTADKTSVNTGESVTFTATVAGVSPGNSTPPTGSVAFMDGDILLGTAPLNGSVASFTTVFSTSAYHYVTAVYSGDKNFTASTSPSLEITVNEVLQVDVSLDNFVAYWGAIANDLNLVYARIESLLQSAPGWQFQLPTYTADPTTGAVSGQLSVAPNGKIDGGEVTVGGSFGGKLKASAYWGLPFKLFGVEVGASLGWNAELHVGVTYDANGTPTYSGSIGGEGSLKLFGDLLVPAFKGEVSGTGELKGEGALSQAGVVTTASASVDAIGKLEGSLEYNSKLGTDDYKTLASVSEVFGPYQVFDTSINISSMVASAVQLAESAAGGNDASPPSDSDDTLVVTAQPPPNVVAGAPFGLSVTAEKADGSPDTTFGGDVTIADGFQAVGGTTTVAAEGGVATFSGLTLDHVDSVGEDLELGADGLPNVDTANLTVDAAAATRLVVGAPDQIMLTDAPFGLQVFAEDPYGNIDPTFSGNVSLNLNGGSGGATLRGAVDVNAVDGVATFNMLSVSAPGSGYTLQAASAGLSTATGQSFSVTNDQLVPQPIQSVAAGAGFDFVIVAEDASSAVDPSFTGNVTIGDPVAGQTLNGATTVTAVDGVATFAGLTLTQAGSDNWLAATTGGLPEAFTDDFDVLPGAPSRLAVMTEPPGNVSAAAPFEVGIAVEDSDGNIETSFTGNVALVLAVNPTGGTLGGTLTSTAIDGVAAFPGLTLNENGSDYTLSASSSGLPAATMSPINVTPPGTATQSVVTAEPPGSVAAGAAFGLTVSAEDSYGTVDPNFNGSVTISNPSGGSLGGTLTVTAVNGVATFTGLSIDQAGPGNALVVSANGLNTATTDTLIVGPLAATQLDVLDPNSEVSPGVTFDTTVLAEDRFGNVDPSFAGNVTVSLGTNPSAAALGGTLTVLAAGGVANFSDLTINEPGSGYTLQATSPGVATGASPPFDVAADQLVIVTPPPTSIASGAAFGMVVAAENAAGTIDSSFNGSVTLSLVDYWNSNGELGGSLTAQATNGQADFSGLSINQNGYYSILATSANTDPAAADFIAPADSSSVSFTSPTSQIYNGSAYSPAVSVSGSTGAVSYDYYVGSGTSGANLGSNAPINAGTYTAVAYVAADSTHAAVTSAPFTFTITPATPTITATDGGGVYIASPYPATATIAGVVSNVDTTPSSSLEGVTPTLTYYASSTATGTPLGGPPSALGTYTVVATFPGSADYASATSGPVTFSIALPVADSWTNSAGGDWDAASNWSLGHVPTAVNAVQITLPGSYTITHSVAEVDAVNSITSDAPINLSAGTLQVATTFTLNGGSLTLAGGTLLGGTVIGTGGAELVTTGGGGILDGVTVAAGTTLDCSSGQANVVDGLTLNGTALVAGGISTGAPFYNYTPAGLFFEGSQTLGGAGTVYGQGTFCGLFAADDGSPATLTIGPGITVYGGMAVGWVEYKVLGLFGFSAAFAGSTDATIANSATIDAQGSTVSLENPVNNGIIEATDGGTMTISGLTGDLGTISLSDSGSSMTINGTNCVNNDGLTAPAGTTLSVSGLTGNMGSLTLGGPGTSVTLNGSGYVVSQNLSVSSGAALALEGTWTNPAGSTIAVTGGTLSLGDQSSSSTNAWSNDGTITATNSTVNIGGAITQASIGTFNRSGGTVNFAGTLAGGLSLNAATGLWNLIGATIDGGTVTATGGAALAVTGATLEGVTLGANLTVNEDAALVVTGGLTLDNANVTLLGGENPEYGGPFTYVNFQGTQTLGGTGQLLFSGNSPYIYVEAEGGDTDLTAATLTIGPNISVVASQGGNITTQYPQDGVVNQGVIDANGNTAAEPLTVGGTTPYVPVAGTFANQGTIEATNGGSLTVDGLTGNLGMTVLSGSGSTLSIGGTNWVNNAGISVSAGASLTLGGLTGNVGSLTLGGSGTSVTLSGSGYVLNQSLSVSAGAALALDGTWANPAGSTIAVTGGTLSLGDQSSSSTNAWSNDGTITATNSTVNIGGAITQASIGTFNRSGGTVNFAGTLAGGLSLNAATGLWNLIGATIDGGTVTATGGAALAVTGATLEGVTLGANLTVNEDAALVVTGGLTLDNANVTLLGGENPEYGGPFTYVNFQGTQTLGGTGQLLFSGNSPYIYVEAEGGDTDLTAATLTIGPNISVVASQGGNITTQYPQDGVVNQGVIDANGNTAAEPLTVGGTTPYVPVAGTFANQGTIEATNGGSLTVDELTNAGLIQSTGGGNVNLNGPLLMNGSSAIAGSGAGALSVTGNLTGNTTNASGYNPLETVELNGTSTVSPQLLEAMSDDVGAKSSGFTNNFAYGAIVVGPSNYVQLVDQSHNSAGSGAEAVYAVSVTVPAGSTLDLNGLHMYVNKANILGNLANGSLIPVGLTAQAAFSGGGAAGNAEPIADGSTSPAPANGTNFGSAPQYLGQLEETFTISNNGLATLNVNAAGITLPSGFTLVAPPAASVSAHASTSFTIALSTTTPAAYGGSVSVPTSDSAANPFTFAIAATITPAVPIAAVQYNGQAVPDGSTTPSTSNGTDFGSVAVGDAPPDETFTIDNDGSAPLDISNLTLPAGYSLFGSPAATVAPGGNTTFTVVLDTDTAGTYAGTISFTTNDSANNPYMFAVTGTVVQLPILIGTPVINGDNPNGLFTAAGQGAAAGIQRSMVEDVVYTFSEPVTILNANAAFTVVGAGPHPGTAPTTLTATAVPGSNGTQWAVTLTGGAAGALGSIANGEYSITINPSGVLAASDGVTQLAAGRTDQFYRLFGDINGDETVNAADNLQLKKALTTYNPAFDSNADGTVNAADNLAFKKDLKLAYFGDGFVPTI